VTAPAYDIGDVVRFTGTFTNVSGTVTDPTTVTLSIKSPSAITSYTYAGGAVTKSGTGVYYKDVSLDAQGTWYWRWVGTGAVATAAEGFVVVRDSEFS